MSTEFINVTSLPELKGQVYDYGHGRGYDGRYRVWTIGDGLPFDALPPYGEGGPALVSIDGWVTSTSGLSRVLSSASVIAADDGMVTVSAWRGDFRNPERHPLHGTKWATHADAGRAKYEAGLLGLMVYERDAYRYAVEYGLPTELAFTIAAEDAAEDAGTLAADDRRTCHSCRMWADDVHLASDRHYLATGVRHPDPWREENLARKRTFIARLNELGDAAELAYADIVAAATNQPDLLARIAQAEDEVRARAIARAMDRDRRRALASRNLLGDWAAGVWVMATDPALLEQQRDGRTLRP